MKVRSCNLYCARKLRWLTCLPRSALILGKRNRPVRATNSTPITMTAPPSGVKSNRAKGSNPPSTRDSLINRLGGVPISVINPPSNVE